MICNGRIQVPARNALIIILVTVTITILIMVVGPLTDAGLNPARDLMPRIWACCVGWGSIAFGGNPFETFMVYCVGPFIGGAIAALLYKYLLMPLHKKGEEADMALSAAGAKSNTETLATEDNSL